MTQTSLFDAALSVETHQPTHKAQATGHRPQAAGNQALHFPFRPLVFVTLIVHSGLPDTQPTAGYSTGTQSQDSDLRTSESQLFTAGLEGKRQSVHSGGGKLLLWRGMGLIGVIVTFGSYLVQDAGPLCRLILEERKNKKSLQNSPAEEKEERRGGKEETGLGTAPWPFRTRKSVLH
ncbi:hypothetical protein EYF80_028601 [Liparis tanakae]|uniref:Uncharacterized protein n=1 Tax=Liparis tanakae TaxID=230148 RepID=A0A4Z2H648_9TELE|nr:hypothetical protein EYF80_028601 [Liparis tanakae]